MTPKTATAPTTTPPNQPAELLGEDHIHQLISDTENLDLETAVPKKRGRRKDHGLSNTPTYTSYREAKRRCSPRGPYHQLGIAFRFKSIKELVAEIGLRPEGHDLDRINPDGHYEPGNVRWLPKSQNRGMRRDPDYFRERAVQAKQHRVLAAQQLRLVTARLWSLSLRYFENGLDDNELLELHNAVSLPQTTFVPGMTADVHGNEVGAVSLPCLNNPGGRFVLKVPANWGGLVPQT